TYGRRTMSGNGENRGWARRASRRRVLQGSAGAALATGIVSLAGCTPASTGSTVATSAPAPAAPAAATPTTTAAQATPSPTAKYGGVFRTAFGSDAPHLDIHLITASTITLSALGPGVAYSKLLQYKWDAKPGETIPTGDLAETWEQSDDV